MHIGTTSAWKLVFAAIILVWAGLAEGQASGPVGIQIVVVGSAEEAQQILDRLKKGEDFAALAREKSTDPSAHNGGYLGTLDPAALREELRDALRGVQPGQLTGIIKLPSGFAVLKVMQGGVAADDKNANPNQILPLAARGDIHYTINLGGAQEADAAFASYPKPDGWEQDPPTICRIRQKSLAAAVDRLHALLDPANPSDQPADPMPLKYVLGQLEAYQGHMEEFIGPWETAYQKMVAGRPVSVPYLEESLGAAYLHKSEMENDVYHHPGERCIFPPQKPMSFANTADSEKSVQYLLKYLAGKPDDLEGRWLLNLAYMTLGKYPDGVPAQFLIPSSVFESKENIGRFVDVAPATGLNLFSMAGGIIVDDFDNDGLLDVVTSSYDMCEHLHFFHNNGDGTFTDRSEQAGLTDELGGLNIIQADYNNDGCMDILVTRGGWQMPMRMSLLRNDCHGKFTDVTQEAGLNEPVATQTAVWADIDNDGFLDLFVGNERGPAHLFRNKGDGTFADISHAAGIDQSSVTKAVVSADYDNDGFMDFYVSNFGGDNFLYHNNHNRTFTEVGKQAGVQQPSTSFAAWFFDYDNDGLPDLFVTSYYMSVEEVMRSYLGLSSNAETLKLFKKLGNGSFRDVTKEVGLDRVFMPMGANFGDVDNDGFLDIYMGMGNPSYASLTPHVLLRNKEAKSFVDVTSASGTGDLHKGHGVSFADINHSGYEDIITVTGGAIPGDAHALRLFENPGNGNSWVNIRLVGVKSNRGAIGARIKVTVENEAKQQRSIVRTVSSGGSFGASPLEQHIGLGRPARIVNLEIWWPASNTRQSFSDVGKNQYIEIKEFAKGYTVLDRKPFRLGGANRQAVAGASR
jgi:hypothetical protein